MKAVVYGRYGSPDVLELTGIDQAVVGDDQVLVRVAWSAQRRRVPSGPAVADAKERLSVTGVKLPWRAGHVNSCVSGREPVENVGRTGVVRVQGSHSPLAATGFPGRSSYVPARGRGPWSPAAIGAVSAARLARRARVGPPGLV
jgi:hypothetical protein